MIGLPSSSAPAVRISSRAALTVSAATPAVRPSSTRVAKPDHEHAVNVACAKLGTVAFEEAWAEGYAMSLEEVVSSTVGVER